MSDDTTTTSDYYRDLAARREAALNHLRSAISTALSWTIRKEARELLQEALRRSRALERGQ